MFGELRYRRRWPSSRASDERTQKSPAATARLSNDFRWQQLQPVDAIAVTLGGNFVVGVRICRFIDLHYRYAFERRGSCEVFAVLRRRRVPFVAYSADYQSASIIHGARGGQWLLKPAHPELLLRAVDIAVACREILTLAG
jgi:hypothetical protein